MNKIAMLIIDVQNLFRETITGKEIYEYHNFVLFKERFAKVESLDAIMKLIERVN